MRKLCAQCRAGAEEAGGVLSVNVNLATEKATVTYLPGAVRRPDLVKAVEASGYGVLDLSAPIKGRKSMPNAPRAKPKSITSGVWC